MKNEATRTPRLWVRVAAIAGIVVLLATTVLLLSKVRPRISAERFSAEAITTIQRESEASFLLTGALDIVATTTVSNTRELLPGLLNVSLGTSRARVQVPGRAHYGVDVRAIRPEHIRMIGDTLIEMTVPTPVVHAVEPNLAELKVWTEKGWLRTDASTRRAERRAINLLNGALTRQAKIHVAQSVQPRVNTAKALQAMLTPVAKSLGMREPVFRFVIGESIVMEPPPSR